MSTSFNLKSKEVHFLNGLTPERCNVLFLNVGEVGATMKIEGTITNSFIENSIDVKVNVDVISSLPCGEITVVSKLTGENLYPSRTGVCPDDASLENLLNNDVVTSVSNLPKYTLKVTFTDSSLEDLQNESVIFTYDVKPSEYLKDDELIKSFICGAFEIWDSSERLLTRECYVLDSIPDSDIKRLAIDSFDDELRVTLTDNKDVVRSYNFKTFSNLMSFIVSKSLLSLDILEQLKSSWDKFVKLFPNKKEGKDE